MVSDKGTNTLLLFVSIVYMFFNSCLLPDGLLWTTLLTPFFFINLLRGKGIQVYFVFLLITSAFALCQLPTVGFLREYLKSFVLMQTVAIFVIHAYYVIRQATDPAPTIKALSTINMVMLGISLLCIFIPVLRPWFWYEMSMSEGLPIIPRLKMLTYEASYYSLIIVPLFVYYFLKKALSAAKMGVLLLSLAASLLLSLSFGVLIALAAAIVLLYLLNLNELKRKINLNYLFAALSVIVIVVVLAYVFNPHNVIFDRFRNIMAGKDTSAKGRTTDSFVLAWNIAKMKSVWFGIGPGQLKLIARDYVIQFYGYTDIPPVARIPNAVAETLNIFGVLGAALRFIVILYLFFKTKVWTNYYRLTLFLFIFIYQFTGSFLFNVAEYVVWILAFSRNLFPVFGKNNFNTTAKIPASVSV